MRTTAGATAFTQMPSVATSFASDLVKPITAGLGGRVAGHIRIAFLAGDRGDADDASVLAVAHVLDHGAAAVEHAGQIDRDDLLPVLVGLLPERRGAAGDAGVVHQDVDAAGARQHLGDRLARPNPNWRYRCASGNDPLPIESATCAGALEIEIGDGDRRAGAQPAGGRSLRRCRWPRR